MKKKDFDSKTYNFSDCREITGEELYQINGGERVENSNEAVANAQVGDTVERNDGTVWTITQGDIDWAKEHTGTGGDNPSPATPDVIETTPESEPSKPAESNSSTGSPPSTNKTSSSSSQPQTSMTNNAGNLSDRGYPSSTEGYTSPSRNTSAGNDINSVRKTNKQNENSLIDKVVNKLVSFIAPDGINVDMNPENNKKNLFLQRPEKKCMYKQESYNKQLFQASIGKREALGIGYTVSGGIVIDKNNIWDSGITVSAGIGIGVEKNINITVTKPINELINIVPGSVDFTKPVSTRDIEGTSFNIYSSAGIGISYDMNKGKIKGLQAGSIGGGVYYEESIAITAGEVAEFAYNTPIFMMNQIFSNSGMNKFVKFDYIELDGQ
ncbi:MAG: hypothetical protein J5527_09925 [Treponema sp.]|nr:hypothetical protein [Treponema sp.]